MGDTTPAPGQSKPKWQTTPRLFVGGLSGRIYVATRWREVPDGGVGIPVETDRKTDVTDQFAKIARNLGWVKP